MIQTKLQAMMRRICQYTLDLFEPEAVPAQFDEKKAEANLVALPTQRDVPPPVDAVPAIALVHAPAVHAPAIALDSAIDRARFSHPRANREVVLVDSCVAFEFKRSKRRTIGFSVGADGLTVSAPKWVPLYEVDAAVREKSRWILKKLDEARARHQRLETARIEWHDGTQLPFLGEQVIVVLDPRHASAGAELNTNASDPSLGLPGVVQLTLHLGLPHTASPAQIRDAVQAWLMRQAKRIFIDRMNHFAPLLGVSWKKLSLSSAGTRWGSASADGAIRLNWRLVHFRMAVIDYVVAHELSHLREMNHSAAFWETVESVLPDYPQLRQELKSDALAHWH